MSLPINYLEFNNPIHILWRSGLPNDPFIDRLDIVRVVNQRVFLLEIPDEMFRVRITGMFEINYDKFMKYNLDKNEFYVDYTNGFVYFHVSKEAETMSIVYKGRGLILYPSTRIAHYDGSDSTETLHEIIEKSKSQVQELIDRTDNYEEYLNNLVIAINNSNHATDQALIATQKANDAAELVKDGYETTVLIYQPYVNTYDEIASKFPYPEVGWTTQVFDTGIRYRWNGKEWTPIDALGGNVPLASEIINGLMSKEQFTKVKNITKFVNERAIVFFIPKDVLQGVQDPEFEFEWDGEIIDVKAKVSFKGQQPTPVQIQKSSNFKDWVDVTDNPLTIDADNHRNNKEFKLINTKVKEGDVFRLYVPSFNVDAQTLTVNVKIALNDSLN
ncbi:hypothetical protein FJQ98_16830 [Lysinibacillus agricola]|uniref:BppU N-terminal domain-containing protein n=1 Tax=Lysinibacillus agricola TaxID=2590012 RepID=A0ABX7APQ7_9BACI|nr:MULTISPECIES: hypothetical protein [Lysinibacillus]KOS61412.1 hypothetical protein AN161_17600 [Lysinibacillus sp. FJAT-14222]QQP10908.1 hypothetical protein FJQ98_16830 [Lysinibacillus agricola]